MSLLDLLMFDFISEDLPNVSLMPVITGVSFDLNAMGVRL